MAPKGFRVDPDKLDAVAQKVKVLLDDLSGASGSVRCNIPDFQQADGHELKTGLAAIWPNWDDGFATGYGFEHTGMMTAYNSIKDQLTALYNACQKTAGTYTQQESNSKHGVAAVQPQI